MWNWFSRLAPKHRTPRARRRYVRPHLEALEDRYCPSGGSLDWADPNGTVYGIAVDNSGDNYITGSAGTNLQTTPGAFQTSGSGAFVAKLNPTGTVLYATYLGNGGTGLGIALDAAGDAYVIGENGNLPTTANAIGSSGSGVDFVAELNPTGSGLLYSTYLPGSEGNGIPLGFSGAIAVDGSGNIDVAGIAGPGLPVTASAYQTTPLGGNAGDSFFAKINPTLSGSASVLYATYLGGSSGEDQASGIAVDSAGNAYLTGFTDSTNFPTTSGAFKRTLGGGGGDAYVAKVNPSLSGAASLVYSTYLGGSGLDGYQAPANGGAVDQPLINGGIAVDSAGNAYITGSTSSANFPTTSGAFQTKSSFGKSGGYGSPSDAFVTKLNPTGTGLVYSTYLGGGSKSQSAGTSIAVDANGDAYLTGWTNSTSFPTKNPIQATNSGGYNAFVTALTPSGSGLLFSTYLGGPNDGGFAIGLDSQGNVYVAGSGYPFNSSTTPAASPTTPSGGFVFKISGVNAAAPLIVNSSSSSIPAGATGSPSASSSQPISGMLASPSLASSGSPLPTEPGQSGLSSVMILWEQDDALALQRLVALLNMEAGAMGISKENLKRDFLFAGLFSSNVM